MRNLSILLALCLASVSALAAAQPLTVAVFDFTSRDESTKDLGPKISALLTALLSAEPDLITLERAELEKALGEQELGLSGTVAPDLAAKVGHLTGAKVLVTGSVFKSGKDTIAVAKIIGSETGRVFGETTTLRGSDSDVTTLSEALARKIAATMKSKGETFVAKGESREDRTKRLLAKAKPASEMAVSVTIPEQHFGRPVNDPAAQTELLSLLQQAGFEIVDAKSDKKADIEITGEAFSAFAMRKGNLSVCKARVELKVAQRAGGKILFTGSQTSVAADLTEPTAAKTALENAALEIAERVLPLLGKAPAEK